MRLKRSICRLLGHNWRPIDRAAVESYWHCMRCGLTELSLLNRDCDERCPGYTFTISPPSMSHTFSSK